MIRGRFFSTSWERKITKAPGKLIVTTTRTVVGFPGGSSQQVDTYTCYRKHSCDEPSICDAQVLEPGEVVNDPTAGEIACGCITP